ncbi:MAG: LysR family transcriptional regulator [Anaerocolumna sp.]
MDLLQLKYFQTVARTEHITRAAAQLHIAQPSLSKVITRLEEDLGVCLFDRQGRQIKLNHYGRAFLCRVDRIFAELEDGKRELSDMIGNDNSKVTIASNNISLFSKLLEGYLKLYPHTNFHQMIGTTAEMQQQLENGTADLCISSPPIEGPGIEYIPLFTEEVYLIIPQDHKFANRTDINLIEAANEPFISLKEGFGMRDLTEKFCHEAGFNPNIVFESDISTKSVDLVNIGVGVGLHPIPPWSDLTDIHPVILHIKEPVCSRTIALSFTQNRYLSLAAKQFKDYTIHYFKDFEHSNNIIV